MTIGQNLWNPRVNSHHISWEFLVLMFLICKNKAQMQGSLSHLAGFLQFPRTVAPKHGDHIYVASYSLYRITPHNTPSTSPQKFLTPSADPARVDAWLQKAPLFMGRTRIAWGGVKNIKTLGRGTADLGHGCL